MRSALASVALSARETCRALTPSASAGGRASAVQAAHLTAMVASSAGRESRLCKSSKQHLRPRARDRGRPLPFVVRPTGVVSGPFLRASGRSQVGPAGEGASDGLMGSRLASAEHISSVRATRTSTHTLEMCVVCALCAEVRAQLALLSLSRSEQVSQTCCLSHAARLSAAFPLVLAHPRPLMRRYDACNRVTGKWVTYNDTMAASAPALCGTRYRPGRERCGHTWREAASQRHVWQGLLEVWYARAQR